MAKQTFFETERDLKALTKQLSIGDTVYSVVNIETSMAPWEDAQLYSAYQVTGWCRISRQWRVSNSTWTIADLVHQGGVHTQPPAGLRNIATPGRQVGGPLPAGQEFDRNLDSAELAYLEGRVATATKANTKAGRGSSGSRWW
ncbi:hypothetical protein [Streptomyces sp. Wh19]|uniref:hypothetical protein n=1 Tax=Streptomyces sp. Wh19 TaxID=3076629 RepID=UPI00295878E3|nr:hypothetical protein [Streptomyces sp. Wh19]MDV9195532.1 hypothetical protein [Streptomyces sp. Wh19]